MRIVVVLLAFLIPMFNQPCKAELPDEINKIKATLGLVAVPFLRAHDSLKFGTAFIIDITPDTQVVLATCRHTFVSEETRDSIVVDVDTSSIIVTFHKDPFHDYSGTLLALDSTHDVAIVSVKDPRLAGIYIQNITAVGFNDLREGDAIASTGYDLLQTTRRMEKNYFWTTTHSGIISSIRDEPIGGNRRQILAFQADLMVNKGASGSPVYLTSDGRVCGMVWGYRQAVAKGTTTNAGIANIVPWAHIWGAYSKTKNEENLSDRD